MMGLLLKFVIGVLIVPVAYGVTAAFYNNLILMKDMGSGLSNFLWGIGIYAILHLLFYKPTPVYVLGHEAVHALIAWLFGGKIHSFKVSAEGGSVSTDKSNVVIELGPYFVPIYAIIITVIYFVVSSSYKVNSSIFLFLIGFTLAFHLISTIEILKVRQPDIVKSGYFFSIVFVYVLNIMIIALLFSMIFKSFSAKRFFVESWTYSRGIYEGIVRQLFF
jgi:hypothetical protein